MQPSRGANPLSTRACAHWWSIRRTFEWATHRDAHDNNGEKKRAEVDVRLGEMLRKRHSSVLSRQLRRQMAAKIRQKKTSDAMPPPIDSDNHCYVGLYNQAQTCYLNSLLQTLYMTPEFRNALYAYVLRSFFSCFYITVGNRTASPRRSALRVSCTNYNVCSFYCKHVMTAPCTRHC